PGTTRDEVGAGGIDQTTVADVKARLGMCGQRVDQHRARERKHRPHGDQSSFDHGCLHTERDETALSRCVGSAADHEGPTADVGCREKSPTWVLDTVRRWGRTGSATIPPRWGRLLRGVVETVFGFMEGGAQNTSCQDATRATSKMRGGHPGGPPREIGRAHV